MGYLIDTSALVRVMREEVSGQWTERKLADTHPWVPVPDDAWEIITSMRRGLAKHSAHQGLSVADYLIAATAVKRNLTILHEDADFETVARLIPMVRRQRISAPPPVAEP